MTGIGNRGHAQEADSLAARHECLAFEAVHPPLPALLPAGGLAVVLPTAVRMHLDAGQRAAAMPQIAASAAAGSLLAMTLRRGPVPAGRRMFNVPAAETIALASMHGFASIEMSDADDGAALQPGVTSQ